MNNKLIIIYILTAMMFGCTDNDISSTLVGYINPGDPQLGEPEGYAGSQTCKECHSAKYELWRGTLHNMALRDPKQRGRTGKAIVADANKNGVADFKDGLDLGVDGSSSDFHQYGANAPILGYSPSRDKCTVMIGQMTFYVDRLYGGNGSFSQIYLTKLDNSYYVLPVKYNEKSRTYSAFRPGNWYKSNLEPLYTPSYPTPVFLGRGFDSFERMCAGCHNTGIFLKYDDETGEYLTGYKELNVGCENCHDAGELHSSLDGGKGVGGIFNPKYLLDGTKDGLKKANEVCGRCHARGSSTATLGGGSYNWFEFPAKLDESGAVISFGQGDVLSDYFTFTTDPLFLWGYNSTDDSFITSRGNHQQLNDINAGAHSPDSGADPSELPTCFTCHDPHGTENDFDIVDSITVGAVLIGIDSDNNTLCLACHASKAPFENISKENVANITDANTFTSIKTEVTKHTKHPYAPEEFKTSKCVSCHMVRAAFSAREYDIASHTFHIITPAQTASTADLGYTPLPNSCDGCHDDTTDSAATKYATFTDYTDDNAVIPASHEQNDSWRETYHKLFIALRGDGDCKTCHLKNSESVQPKANPGCTTHCHGV